MPEKSEPERYDRQMPVFGEEGQERIKNANVFIAGAGGLGPPVSMYLAAAGIGTLATNRLLIWDGLNTVMNEISLERNPKCRDCRDCGDESVE